ncbi:DUF3289 family protein [Actinoplanes oblitus]|uniref:DUF3289 family protein n=1 Tax=Actinoplanes oblitus TaxID=3040509 RepID=A0ABY8W6P4_9ACTN|nr:DUF3289 family protein [Actinoplanes oblitus]WIM92697.1 DUF3289 family protein [Actinoplanes oblitus]
MRTSQYLHRLGLSIGTSMLMVATAAPAVAGPVASPATGETIYRDTTVDVSYRRLVAGDPQWSSVPRTFRDTLPAGSYIAQLQIKNVSGDDIDGWSLSFESPDRITATAAAKLDAPRGLRATIQNDPADKLIEAGTTSTLWYRAQDGRTAAYTPRWATFAKGGARPAQDTDGDGLPDDMEQRAKLDPRSPDTDRDGLSDFLELGTGTSPSKADSDGDGVRDGSEDTDGDKVTNQREAQLQTALTGPDTDSDGLADGQELARRTSPVKPDTDGDGVDDGEETRIGSDPRAARAAFDVTRSADGGATTASATIKGLGAHQVPTFRITELPADQRQFPASTPGHLGNGYEFSVDGRFAQATMTFKVDPERTGADVKPAVYRYDDTSQRLVKVVDQRIDGGTITATTATAGKYVVLDSHVFDEVWDQASRTGSVDTDGDGISDYYENESRAGRLRQGNGVPLGALDPNNADTDGDSLTDGTEVRIATDELPGSQELVYAKLTSNPLRQDTDGDGTRDGDDGQPQTPDPVSMLIHQSQNREGRRKEPDPEHFQVPPSQQVADDLTFNDYTYGELTDLDWDFWVARITPEFLMWGEFNDIMNIGKVGAAADNQQAVDDLRNAFHYGRNGQSAGTVSVDDNYDPAKYLQVGSGTALSRAVAASPQEQSYIDKAKGIIVQSITDNLGGVAQFQVQDDLNLNLLYQLFDSSGLHYPVYDFSVTDANQRALSIAIHQFHGHTIELRNYVITGNTFSGTLLFHSYDHFGLDPDDEITNYGFIDWFTLQHYDRFNGKYPPAIAVADVEVPISGSF